MPASARPWIIVMFRCLCILALVFAFVFFMRMQEEQSTIDRYRAQGNVSRALVIEKNLDAIVLEGRAGRTRSQAVQLVRVRYVPDSTVRYADFPARVREANLPAPPPATGDALTDSRFTATMLVPRDTYDAVRIGQTVTVVDTPFSGDEPILHDDIANFDAAIFYPRIAAALFFALLFGFVSWRMGRVST